ncbi:MAG: 23S rRNA (adenine(2503)-C(2))-methyltransferase RlmN, partial [Deltaproteobacteria bacterium]|nr:23S rRNA (adenine(2503)-C(2))-methyltransferase RlmN [Deltaproteobacteria bacterium]
MAEDLSNQHPEDLFNLTIDDLQRVVVEEFGQPAFRAVQTFEWVYSQGVTAFSEMTNLPPALRKSLEGRFYFPEARVADRQISSDGTRKYLLEVDQGQLVESVMIKQPTRMTLCVSSQVGCGMGCAFCRTATMGFRRHLSTSEIIRQVRAVIKDAKNFGDSFSNIVFMGMGEPLHNFKGITGAIKILTHQKAFSIAPRRITVSTVGLVPAIQKFGESDLKVNLAVSLNATTDEVRQAIMPV